MNVDIKAQWIAALRSGEYKQGSGWLNRSDTGYCCLGVLCELAEKAGVVTKETTNTGLVTRYSGPGEDDDETTLLPWAVVDWAGLDDNYGNDNLSLPEKNDSGMTFADIALIIEENL